MERLGGWSVKQQPLIDSIEFASIQFLPCISEDFHDFFHLDLSLDAVVDIATSLAAVAAARGRYLSKRGCRRATACRR